MQTWQLPYGNRSPKKKKENIFINETEFELNEYKMENTIEMKWVVWVKCSRAYVFCSFFFCILFFFFIIYFFFVFSFISCVCLQWWWFSCSNKFIAMHVYDIVNCQKIFGDEIFDIFCLTKNLDNDSTQCFSYIHHP